jgi:hypothetical protein
MKHRSSQSTAAALATLWVFVAACDKEAEVDATASANAQAAASVSEADAKIKAKDFDLEAVAGVMETGKIESAAELEVIINDDARGINHIDIDADGKIDHVQVGEVEVEGEAEGQGDADVVFALRVIPSSSGSVDEGVVFATTTFTRHSTKSEVEIRTSYTDVVWQPEVIVYTHVVPVRLEAGVVVGGSVFLSWVFAVDRAVYVGVYTVDEHGYWIPPGHAKHGHWKANGHGRSDSTMVIGVHGGGGGTMHITGSSHGGQGGKGGKGGKGKWK